MIRANSADELVGLTRPLSRTLTTGLERQSGCKGIHGVDGSLGISPGVYRVRCFRPSPTFVRFFDVAEVLTYTELSELVQVIHFTPQRTTGGITTCVSRRWCDFRTNTSLVLRPGEGRENAPLEAILKSTPAARSYPSRSATPCIAHSDSVTPTPQ